jgi:hypothetical protein
VTISLWTFYLGQHFSSLFILLSLFVSLYRVYSAVTVRFSCNIHVFLASHAVSSAHPCDS